MDSISTNISLYFTDVLQLLQQPGLTSQQQPQMVVVQVLGGGSGQQSTINPVAPRMTPVDEEPLYVNAKQYHRILKRRAARAKLEAEGRIPKQRRVSYCYIHT